MKWPRVLLPLSYQLRLGNQQEKIPFMATTDLDVEHVYWFLDESYIGKAKRGKLFFWIPKPGNYVVRVIDSFGRGSSRSLKVELVK